MNTYEVRYEVRQLGAIGIFWTMADTISARTSAEAFTKFRERWGYKYEFRFPVSAKPL